MKDEEEGERKERGGRKGQNLLLPVTSANACAQESGGEKTGEGEEERGRNFYPPHASMHARAKEEGSRRKGKRRETCEEKLRRKVRLSSCVTMRRSGGGEGAEVARLSMCETMKGNGGEGIEEAGLSAQRK